MNSTKPQFDIDPELFRGFLDDSLESLASLEPIFIHLEADPNDLEVVDQVFRPVHSIKGNAGFFKLSQTNNFAHRLETLLDRIRKREMLADHNVVELLLQGVDELKAMLVRVSEGLDEVADQGHLEQLGRQLDTATNGYSIEEHFRLLSERITELASLARQANLEETASEVLLEVETVAELNQTLVKILGTDQADKKEPGLTNDDGTDKNYFFKETNVSSEIHTLSNILSQPVSGNLDQESVRQVEDALKELEQKLNDQAADIADAMLDDYNTMINSAVGFDGLLRELLADKLSQMKSLLQSQPKEPNDSPDTNENNNSISSRASSSTGPTRTMRIAEEKLDDFMKYVGELIMVSDSLDFLQRKLENTTVANQIIKEFRQTKNAFRLLSDQLQGSLLEIRKVPARTLLQRIPRMARDLSDNLDKKVDVEISGDDILIDKTLLEALNDPITHLVRNCLDHGIEPPQQRQQVNKPETGTIKVVLKEEQDQILFSISDDGKGIDSNTIRAKAIEKGLLKQQNAASLNDCQLLQYIFAPGFSTAAQVSDVSGRGVGMDVVRTNVENLNGSIQIDSTPGKGTQIQLKLPTNTTVVVVSCMLVGVGTQRLLIPLESIRELIRPENQNHITIHNCGETLNIRNQLYPLLHLHKIFDIEPKFHGPNQGLIALIEAKNQYAALMLDEVYGQQRVVIKKLQGNLANLNGIAGAAVLGDGRIGIVLDVADLIGRFLTNV